LISSFGVFGRFRCIFCVFETDKNEWKGDGFLTYVTIFRDLSSGRF
jgi:hypothetical protein